MTLLPPRISPQEEAWVALDLETTGLSADGDEIIEIGAAKFQGRDVLATYQTLVNPGRRLDDFIKGFTGIAQREVDEAPPFAAVAGELGSFLGAAPIVGHNVAFDLGFLAKKGMALRNPRCDTWDLAFVVIPGLGDYSLATLSRWAKSAHSRRHRALDDALATMDVFLELVAKLSEQDVFTLAEMRRLAGRSTWSLPYILERLATTGRDAGPVAGEEAQVGISGLDSRQLRERLRHGRPLRPNRPATEVDVELATSLVQEGGALSKVMPGFEERTEQVAMTRAVAEAINDGRRLIVEAGTGVGKSMAYLVPAALYALMNNKRVVVSTNTISLQEQLMNKDVPLLVKALEAVPGISARDLRYTQLKGRANYLCMKRWNHLRTGETLSDAEARLMAKTLLWLKTTETGDRSELNLGRRSAASAWERLSAQGAVDCPSSTGPCFLRAAREKAAASHLVIVNHALLLSDLTIGGTLLPEYDVLIIDEAHHLEEEATRHLGFELGRTAFEEQIQSVAGDRGVLNQAVAAFRGSTAALTRRRSVEELAADAAALAPSARDHLARMFALLESIVSDQESGDSGHETELRVTTATRAQPGWSNLDIQWENVDLTLSGRATLLARLEGALDGLEEAGLIDYEGLLAEVANQRQVCGELRQRLGEFISQPKKDTVYWVARRGRDAELILCAAPLHVGETLDSSLFGQKSCVVMTSATLSANGSFDHICERTGFGAAEELLVGSPFDYPNSALLCVPDDMPEPGSPNYQAAIAEAVTQAALAVGGQTMALFTSHASLRATAVAIRGGLQARNIAILAQGVDGTPARLVRRFLDDPKSVLLGTASFWEGVDLAGEALKVLLVARLPFSVPTEPVFAARSELYESPFNEYAVPQAVLRLRQGFGRLIRTKADRGVAVILDRRILSRRYGKSFVNSLPPLTVETCSLAGLPDEIRGWVG